MLEDHSHDQRLAFCQAMANMVASDRKVTPAERRELDGLIRGARLSPDDPEVIAIVDAELAKPGDIKQILKKITSRDLHAGLFRMLIEMACVDGEVPLEERAKIEEAAATFGFNKDAAEELISWTLESIQLERKERDILAKLS